MVNILFITDSHITAKNPASRTDDICETIKYKFKDVKDIIDENKVNLVIHGGDMFHTSDVSNKFTGEIAEIIRSWNAPLYVVPGNHDLAGYSMETLEHSKLGLLEKTGVLDILSSEHNLKFNLKDKKIVIRGQEYYKNIDCGNKSDFIINDNDFDFGILVYHGMLLDHEFFHGARFSDINKIETNADIILAGHYHPGFDERLINNTKFINPGSMLRIENTKINRETLPKCCLLSLDVIDNKVICHDKFITFKSAKNGDEIFKGIDEEKADYERAMDLFKEYLSDNNFKGTDILFLADEYLKENKNDKEIIENIKKRIYHYASQDIDNGYVESTNNVYIKKAVIKNFQVHKNKTVEFDNKFNIIKGESNSGKTAILRSIYWCLYDKPNGSDFIRTGAKSCSVELEFSNGFSLIRKRNRSSSGSYILKRPDGSSEEYKGFNNQIPVDILNATQMPEVNIAGNKYRLNIASQFESPFLLSYSPSEKANVIGSLVKADKADMARKDFASEKIRLSSNKKLLINEKEEKENALSKFKDIDVIEKVIPALEHTIKKYDDLYDECSTLKNIKSEYISLVGENQTKVNLIMSCIDELNILSSQYVEIMKSVAGILEIKSEYSVVCNDFNFNFKEKENIEHTLIKLNADLNDRINKINKENIKCPTCGSIVKAENILN